jgi:hypothetical protein
LPPQGRGVAHAAARHVREDVMEKFSVNGGAREVLLAMLATR